MYGKGQFSSVSIWVTDRSALVCCRPALAALLCSTYSLGHKSSVRICVRFCLHILSCAIGPFTYPFVSNTRSELL